MKPFFPCFIMIAGAGALLAATPARAAVEFTTLVEPGDGFYSAGLSIEGSSESYGYIAEANVFTASFTGEMTGVRIGVSAAPPISDDPAMVVSLYANSSASVPLVSTQQVLGTIIPSNSTGTLQTLTLAEPLLLTAGTTYWLALAPASATSLGVWNDSEGPDIKTAYSHDGSQTFQANTEVDGAFEIDATPAPEPSTWAMLFGGVGLLVAVARKQLSQTA